MQSVKDDVLFRAGLERVSGGAVGLAGGAVGAQHDARAAWIR